MENNDLYWLAGLLEGEGCFQKPAPSQPSLPRILLRMTDKDVIVRVADLFGVQYIYERLPRKIHWKLEYAILVKGNKAIEIMCQLYPLMGERRKTQIQYALGEAIYATPPGEVNLWFYWLVGLLEGEGSFQRGMPSKPNKTRIQLNMTDGDVVERAANLMNVRAKGPYKRGGKDAGQRPRYFAFIYDSKARDLMIQLRPYMSQRRQIQIDTALASYQHRGHPQGNSHPQAKLTTEKVRNIRSRIESGQPLSQIAREYEVDTSLIWQIKARRIWQHIE